ncbi:MAG: nodulation protein NfeD [Chloroflexi bacterium]|nr:nodulation protein NfeD [Chloroflexota bacterium]
MRTIVAWQRLRVALCASLIALGILTLVGPTLSPTVAAQPMPGTVRVVSTQGAINPSLAQYLSRTIDQAERDRVAALVIALDTPGGLDTSMRQIIQRILASHVPVVVYVSPPGARAASAGVYVTYAAHVAAMAPNTTIGSATPVAMGQSGGEQTMSPEMRAKVTNDAVSYIKTLAERRGRNVAWAEQAVREAVNVTEREALDQGIVDVVASDVGDLLRQIDGRTVDTVDGQVTLSTASAPVEQQEMGLVDELLHAISDPTIAYLLLSLGTMGLFFELSNPGAILPGVVGGICVLLGVYALGALPVNYAGLFLMGFAFVLFAADLFAPSHGVLTLGGFVSFVLGSFLLFQVPGAGPWLHLSLWTIASVSLFIGVFFAVIVRLVARGQRGRVTTGREGLIGQIGQARTSLMPTGMVFVDGALWEATTDGEPIPAGAQVEVLAMDGLKLLVRPNHSQQPGGSQPVISPPRAPAVPAKGQARPSP